tara:strand:- start:1137 stop:1541 length:405 start_codon:yes stop_codon:yes gene_type:complete
MSCSPEVIDFMDACYNSQKNLPERKKEKKGGACDTRVEPVSVVFKKNTKRKSHAPPDSKFRDLYTFSIGNSNAQRDCWHWWRDPIDGIIRILGGNQKTKEPTIYMITLKQGKISVPKDEDQSKARHLYNQYGRK